MEKQTKWLDKPYNNLNAALRDKFGEKIIKLSVDGGFYCPNRDGTVGEGGCIFCSGKGSGDFAGSRHKSIQAQLQDQILFLKEKWPKAKYMAYFQSYSNTYGEIGKMEKMFREAIAMEDVVGLAIATRVDCLNDEVINLLEALHRETYLWVEFGLQSIYPNHHNLLNTGYKPSQFQWAVETLSQRGIEVVGHIILGLPDMPIDYVKETVDFINSLPLKGLKIHMLNILKETQLACLHRQTPLKLLSMEAYIHDLISIIEQLRQDIVIHRVTGDGAKDLLIEPNWILNKRKVLNEMMRQFKIRETYQGKYLD